MTKSLINGVYFRGITKPKDILDIIQEDVEIKQALQVFDIMYILPKCNNIYFLKTNCISPVNNMHPALSDNYWNNFEQDKSDELMKYEYAEYIFAKYSLNN